jgi:hypothetical protein
VISSQIDPGSPHAYKVRCGFRRDEIKVRDNPAY